MFVAEKRGVIFDAAQQPTQGKIAFFTSLCALQSGVFLCGFQNGPGKHAVTSTVRLCRSTDGGVNWELIPHQFETAINGIPGSLGAAELVETSPGRLLLFATWLNRSDPDRPLFDPVTEGILKSKQLLSISHDDGVSWSNWRELKVGDLKGCALTGPLLRWDDGTIAFPFESFKEYDDPRPGRHAAWMIVSRDEGATFSEPLLVAQHPEHQCYYWDQRLCVGKAPGEFTAMFWTHDLIEKRDRNVHLRSASVQDNTIVLDPIRESTVPGQIAAPLITKDGRLLAFVVDRSQPGTMTLWCSRDGGNSWLESDRLIIYKHDEHAALSQGRDNIDFKQYWEDMGKWTFGHPAIRPLSKGRILLAWYAGTPNCMSIHWAQVRDSAD